MEINENALTRFADTMSKEMTSYRRTLKGQAKAFDKRLAKYVDDSVCIKGKSIRPMLVFASSWYVKQDSKMLNRACSVELIHLASLIHDDIIDNADLRRSKPTIFKKYGLKVSILIGDAIFAHAMSIMTGESELISKSGVEAVKELCEGEITQSIINADKKTTFKDYFEIIEKKTAVLFGLSCLYGAELTGDEKWVIAAKKAGIQMGIAYQIYDDICDWVRSSESSGKTVGTDLISGKRTLPILLLEKDATKSDNKLLAEYVKQADKPSILNMMKKYDIFEKCKQEFAARIEKSKKIISKFDTAYSKKLGEFCEALNGLL